MKYKRMLLIIGSVLFFFCALTFWLNRVLFPQLIKKIAIERIEETLKRKVEISSIHFNWVRGFIIDKIKVYEKDPPNTVFAQADQVSFGILFFPGFKQTRITIPFINVRSPSMHLIRTGESTWNFSDIYAPSASSSVETEKPSAFQIAWGGITISDGKVLIDDTSTPHPWSEYFDNINLKLSLSYKGINYDFTADIPGKKGYIGATVNYQPITKNTQAQIHLRNIDTASYLSLVKVPDVHLDSGTIKQINLDIHYTPEKISAQGDIFMENLDVASTDESFKGNIEIHGLDAQYQNGDITARGQMALSGIQAQSSGLSFSGSAQANANEFELTKNKVSFLGSLHAQDFIMNLKDRLIRAHGVTLDNMKVNQENDSIQSVGNIAIQGLVVQWPDQKLQGDISLKSVNMHVNNKDDISLEGELQADNFSDTIGDKTFNSRHIVLEGARLDIKGAQNISLNTKVSLDQMILSVPTLQMTATIKSEKLMINLDDDIIKISTVLNASEGKFILDDKRSIEANPQLELTMQMPLHAPKQLTYKGSITLSDAVIRGLAPVPILNNVELDADFQNDEATINALSANILDTNVRVSGTVKNFKKPFLNILAEADELNLSKIKEIAPRLVDQYGLIFDGTSFVKVKFEGLASEFLAGKILAVATVKHASVSSHKFHQRINNITGIIEATPNSLQWHDFTATYGGQKYALSGSLENFKNPKILATLSGPGLELKTDLTKKDDRITIRALSGKYLNVSFDSKGSVTLPAGREPVFDINSNVSLLLEDFIKALPAQQIKNIGPFNPAGTINVAAELKGTAFDWKNYQLNATISSPSVSLRGYSLADMKIKIVQDEGKVKNLTFDGKLYDGTVHGVGSLDLLAKGMPYEMALNIDNTDLHKLKMDSPLKMEEIDGKFFLTTLAHGTIAGFKNNLHATGSLAIRDGFLAEFNLFKGLLSILNDAMHLGQVMITDVEGNFTIEDQKINTDNLRLKGPTIVLLGKGWVNFDELCDLDVTVDLSSGAVPSIAHDVLNTLNIHIYDKIANPKFKKKISMPQVINTLLKNFLQ